MQAAIFKAARLLLCALACVSLSQGAPEQTLQWQEASDVNALCNDRTRAGFFISRNFNTSDVASSKWVIYLESGTLCFSNDTCNRRFFNREIRDRFNALAPDDATEFPPFGRFNPQDAWDGTVNNPESPQAPETVINPLMSSMQCFKNVSNYFPDGFELTGSDILDRDPTMNKLFPNHNHVIIPYCSSDLWLGEETGGRGECSCFNFTCNEFDPSSESLDQFTFRGQTIFKAIFRQLMDNHNLSDAVEVVLAGSSAGGVGVVNHAQWAREQLVNAELLVLFDSAWFVNFQDSIYRIFDGTLNRVQSEAQRMNTGRLLSLLQSHPACNDTSLGYPCCVSAHCMFTRTGRDGLPLYFPSDVRAFAISSVYDVFLLAPAAQQVYDESEARQEQAPRSLGSTGSDEDDQNVGADFVLDFLRLVGEYGGVMNNTLIDAARQFPNLGFYLPQCVQHLYFATSSLWGPSDRSVFGDSGINLDLGAIASFNHTVRSGRWNDRSKIFAVNPSSQNRSSMNITIQDALVEWYFNQNTSRINPYQYRASCQGPYCYPQSICPDVFELSSLTANSWPDWSKILIAVLIVMLSIITLFVKVLFALWLYRLERKQDIYLFQLEESAENEERLTFPTCLEEDAIAVSCLDINYSVTFRAKKAVKDEKKDQTAPIVLNNIAESSSDSEDEEDEFRRESRLFSFGELRRGRTTRTLGAKRPSQFRLPDFDFSRRRPSAVDQKRRKFSKNKGSVSPHRTRRSPPPVGSNDSQAPILQDLEEQKKLFGYRKKEILKGISVYFNPGEMVAVMGPSGCGKTTFLDLMTGRRKTGNFSGEIYINGIPMDEIRDWYVANTGYVLQLATPYYEELTVRENITLAAQLKLPEGFTLREKFERTEQVLQVTGLSKLAHTMVGGATGPGLSGGQKRRLAVALQLLKLPNMIFLDEPTSGLDATGSFELLSHLNKLADSNRTVVLTIHQPRLEIFHMFDRLVLLSDGRVAYHGAPEKAYEVFVNALTARYLEQGLVIPELEDHNPADVIMDMLGNQKMRQIITEHYHMSDEPRLVRRAITAARWKEYSTSVSSIDSIGSTFSYALFGTKKTARRQPDMFTRMATLEARGAKKGFVFFLPFMFFAFGFVLGTVYLQQTVPLYIISGVCVFSVASGLFMFPAMYPYYQRALEVYGYERADGVGRAADLVLQGFVRFSSLSVLPAIFSASILYLMLINYQFYNVLVFLQVVLVNIALSQTWITLLIALICAIPNSAFRVSSGISAVAGFTSGFFIPVEQLGWWWRWLVYINPNYYAVSSVAVFVLSDFNSCAGSSFGCFLQSGTQVLRQFNFDQVNPYLHLVIILGFTIFYLFLAIFVNWVRHTSINSKLKRFRAIVSRKSNDMLSKEFDKNPEEFAKSFSIDRSIDEPPCDEQKEPVITPTTPLNAITEEDENENGVEPLTPHSKAARNWQLIADRSLQQEQESGGIQRLPPLSPEVPTGNGSGDAKVAKKVRINDERPHRPTMVPLKSEEEVVKSAYLREGDSHRVWRPKKAPQLADLVSDLLKNKNAKQNGEPSVATTPAGRRPPLLTPSVDTRRDLKARQKTVFNRVLATQELLRETTDELLKEEEDDDDQPKSHLSLLEASKKITANIKKQRSAETDTKGDEFSSVVRKCLERVRSKEGSVDAETPTTEPSPVLRSGGNALRNRRGSKRMTKFGAVPLKKWKNFARQETRGLIGKIPAYDRAISEYPLKKLPDIPEPEPDHKALGRSTSADGIAAKSSRDESSFGVTFINPTSSSSSLAQSHRANSPINITMSDSSVTTPPAHQPLLKKDSHGVMKQSKFAQLKGAAGRRSSSGLPRQSPIDVEGSLTALAASGAVTLTSYRHSGSPEGVSGGDHEERLLLSDPPHGRRQERGESSVTEDGVTVTML